MVITIFTGKKKSTYAFFRQINVITKGLISREIFERNRGTAFYTHFWYMLLSRIFSNFHIVSERKFYNLPSLNIQTFSLSVFSFSAMVNSNSNIILRIFFKIFMQMTKPYLQSSSRHVLNIMSALCLVTCQTTPRISHSQQHTMWKFDFTFISKFREINFSSHKKL